VFDPAPGPNQAANVSEPVRRAMRCEAREPWRKALRRRAAGPRVGALAGMGGMGIPCKREDSGPVPLHPVRPVTALEQRALHGRTWQRRPLYGDQALLRLVRTQRA
jgi:hypothetical protein